MLKEYTLKVTVRVGGRDEEDCDETFAKAMNEPIMCDASYEITHEEVVEVDPWMSQIELDKFPPVEPEVERE